MPSPLKCVEIRRASGRRPVYASQPPAAPVAARRAAAVQKRIAYESASDDDLDDGIGYKIGRELLETDSDEDEEHNRGLINLTIRDLIGRPAMARMKQRAQHKALERRERRRIERQLQREREEQERQRAIRLAKLKAMEHEYYQYCRRN